MKTHLQVLQEIKVIEESINQKMYELELLALAIVGCKTLDRTSTKYEMKEGFLKSEIKILESDIEALKEYSIETIDWFVTK